MIGWVKIKNNMPTHPKILRLSDSAFAALVRAICYCDANQTDGIVPSKAMRMCIRSKYVGKVIDEMLAAGVIESPNDQDVFAIHDYLDHQRSVDDMALGREEAATRQRRSRHRAATVQPSCSDVAATVQPSCSDVAATVQTALNQINNLGQMSHRDTAPTNVTCHAPREEEEKEKRRDPPVVPHPHPDNDRPSSVTKIKAENRYAEAWAKGIGRGNGVGTCSTPTDQWALGEINNAVSCHAKGLRGASLIAWLERAAEAFARSPERLYGGLTPRRFRAWLDSGKLVDSVPLECAPIPIVKAAPVETPATPEERDAIFAQWGFK